jgi:hypothetical protein
MDYRFWPYEIDTKFSVGLGARGYSGGIDWAETSTFYS